MRSSKPLEHVPRCEKCKKISKELTQDYGGSWCCPTCFKIKSRGVTVEGKQEVGGKVRKVY